jgi:hypothetical protein
VGNFAQEEKFSSPCNGLFALEGISFSTGSLRVLRGERYGLCNGPSNNCASFDTAGRGVDSLPRSFTAYFLQRF